MSQHKLKRTFISLTMFRPFLMPAYSKIYIYSNGGNTYTLEGQSVSHQTPIAPTKATAAKDSCVVLHVVHKCMCMDRYPVVSHKNRYSVVFQRLFRHSTLFLFCNSIVSEICKRENLTHGIGCTGDGIPTVEQRVGGNQEISKRVKLLPPLTCRREGPGSPAASRSELRREGLSSEQTDLL